MWLDDEVAVVGRHEKVYYLRSGPKGLLVDCGSEASYDDNLRALSEDGADPRGIIALLVTHEHYDHIGSIGRAKAELGCPVIAHRLAAEAVESTDPLVTASENRFLGTHVPFIPAVVDCVVDEGDTILLGTDRVEVYHIPGHTPGGAAYFFKGRLIVGDTVFLDGGIGWPDVHWGSNLADHRESIEKIRRISPDYLLPGHGEAGEYSPRIPKLALEKLDCLESAGVPSIHTLRAERSDTKREPRVIDPEALSRRSGTSAPRSSLRSSASYEFRLKDLFGFVRPWGPYHGLVLFGLGGAPITQPGTCTLNVEHYCSQGTAAPFLPRDTCAKFHSIDEESIWIGFTGTSAWPVNTKVTYQLRSPNLIDATFEFKFQRSFKDFEAFVASYFQRSRVPFVRTTPGWTKPQVKDRQQLFVARDDRSAAQTSDGRWGWLEHAEIEVAVHPSKYESAVLVDWDEQTGWAFAQMIEPDLCPSLSLNTFCHAQDFSLVGRDVAAGESVKARCRVVYQSIASLEEVDEIYHTFLERIEAAGDQT